MDNIKVDFDAVAENEGKTSHWSCTVRKNYVATLDSLNTYLTLPATRTAHSVDPRSLDATAPIVFLYAKSTKLRWVDEQLGLIGKFYLFASLAQ